MYELCAHSGVNSSLAGFAGLLQNWDNQLSAECVDSRAERCMRLSSHSI